MTSHLKTLVTMSYLAAAAAGCMILLIFANLGCQLFFTSVNVAANSAANNPVHGGLASLGLAFDIAIAAAEFLITIVVIVLNLMAAKRYATGTGYQFLMITAIVNLIPCLSLCCPVVIGIGVYSLIVLLNDDVKNLFKAVAAGKTLEEAMAPQVKEGE